MDGEETHEIIQARNRGKIKDLRIRETDGMLMQESRMYVPKNMELKKAILDKAHISAYAMHPGDGQSEMTIQMLEDMLRSLVLQFGDTWHKRLDLMKFAYNNNFHSSIGSEIVEETTQNIQVIKSNLKAAQDRQNSLADRHATDQRKKGKLSPRDIGPYMITERVGEVAYRLELPPELSKLHDVFHVFMLRHYVSDLSHVIPPQPLEINSDLTYDEEPVTILDWKDKVMRNKTVRFVKVLWRNHLVEETTWDTEERMKEIYPHAQVSVSIVHMVTSLPQDGQHASI
ncbi:unnamed protein product [Malus baccata var. baccata]